MLSKKEVNNLIRLVESGEIDLSEAEELISAVEFYDRVGDILEWGAYYMPDKFSSSFCEFHRYMVSVKDDPFTTVLAPRGFGKTLLQCLLIPMYLSLNNGGYWHFLNCQSTTRKAISVNISIKHEFESNDKLIRDYGNQVGAKWTEKQFVLKNGTIFSSIGAGESMRGINYGNRRPDFVNLDDLYDESDIENPEGVTKKNRWFWGSLYKAMASGRKTCIHIRGTAIHRTDLMHTLPKMEGITSRRFQSYDELTMTPLWPDMMPIKKLLKDKELMGSTIFNREMQNELRDDATAIIKEADIQIIDSIPLSEVIKYKVMSLDPASKTGEANDPSGSAIAYVSELGNVYFVYLGNDKISMNKSIERMKRLHEKHNFSEVRIEAISGFGLLVQEVRRATSLPVKEISHVKDKITRLIAVQSKFENKKVFFLSTIEKGILDEAVYQLTNNKPTHDDVRDAIVMCLEDYRRQFQFGVA
jgi:predicted phage terminase large subunit-like protein